MRAAEIIAKLPRLSSAERADVEAKVRELVEPIRAQEQSSLAAHPAIGIWMDHADLPADSTEASKALRDCLRGIVIRP